MLFHCPTALHHLLGEESIGLVNDESSLLLTDSKKISQLYYVTKMGFTACYSHLYNTKVKFYKSYTKEN
jgi:hypothetical protein